jgi:SAM-dependent methyltransferase
MAAFARRRGLEVEVAPFEEWDPANRQFDAVVSGQAWHWVDPVAGAVKAAQVLPPGGRLAVFWNVFAPPSDISNAFSEVYRRVVPEWPRNPWVRPGLDSYGAIAERSDKGLRAAGRFTEPEQWRFDWERPYSRGEWLEQMATGGDASQFTPAKLDALLAGAGAVIDAFGGRFTMQYVGIVVTAARISP